MKAAVLREVGKPLSIEEVQIGKPGPHEVLIRTAAAGVCHSDLHFIEGTYPGPMPAVLGHESAGVVEQVGDDVRTVKVGDHVITCLSVFCGHCEDCLTGHMSLCRARRCAAAGRDAAAQPARPGRCNQFLNLSSFAEQMLIHEHACVAIRKDMPLDRAALIGCGVTTGVGAVIHTSQRAARRDRRGDRLRRRRPGGDQRRGDRRRRPDHRHRHLAGEGQHRPGSSARPTSSTPPRPTRSRR